MGRVAVYAEPDLEALHARARRTRRSRWVGRPPATAIWTSTSCSRPAGGPGPTPCIPGYGFLSENAEFAAGGGRGGTDLDGAGRAAGDPAASGDKVEAAADRPRRVGAPLVAQARTGRWRTRMRRRRSPRSTGCPIAIKAAFGGGGRGLKVARTPEEIPEQYGLARCARPRPPSAGASATWSATSTSPAMSRCRCSADTARHGGRGRRPRLLAPAAAPEAGRGGPGARPARTTARADASAARP